ncbi:unnamed protein product [Phytophthora lilii]|uniref:Unnamed protein product n=1 Tax=Phytophthora lilii TaxID=2077276 RepID=A0A9W6YDC8_9STRA|nr:unnamed protein product [Phytophthora lilii]
MIVKQTNGCCGSKPRLSQYEKGRIEGLREGGLSIRAVAQKTGRCTHTVRRIIAPAKSSASPARPSPPPALTDRDIRRLVRAAAKGDSSAAQLKTDLNFTVLERTIQRILAKVNWLVYTRMVSTLPLTPKDMKVHKVWASNMLVRKDAGSVWDSIIFSDEKKWNLDGPDGFQHYWRDLRQAPRHTKRRQAGSGSSLMVWDDYVFTVSKFLLPFAHLNYGTDFVYQQDNASIHVFKRTMEFFGEQDIQVLDWLSKSPDLNPIENLWSMLSRKVYANGRQFDSVHDLKAALFDAWEDIPHALLLSLVESMPRRSPSKER